MIGLPCGEETMTMC